MPVPTRELLQEIGSVMKQIDAVYAGYKEGARRPEIRCPRCSTPLNYGKAVAINGHRNAFCPNEDCNFGFVE